MEDNSDEMEKMEEPLLGSKQDSTKGGFRTLPSIIGNEASERLASCGLTANMIVYMRDEYKMDMVTGNNILNIWNAASNFLPVVGAFVSDSFVGRYPMIALGSIFSLLGMIMLWSTTMIPQARPSTCIQSSSSCSSSTAFQVFYLCCSFGIMSIGSGGIRASSMAFGTDQLKVRDSSKSSVPLERYFGWYYATTSIAVLFAMSCIVYMQDHLGWKIGFGILVVLMFVTVLSFFLASPFYIKVKSEANFLISFAQVAVATYRNRNTSLLSESTSMAYHHQKGSALIAPSDYLRFLNKACTIRYPGQYSSADEIDLDSWNVCTVDQVEDVKAVIRVIPLWSTGAIMCVNLNQPSFPVIQARSMDRHITSWLEIPAGSFGTPKQRMGIGILLSIFAQATMAIIELFRREMAIEEGLSGDTDAVVEMSAMWLLLPNCLNGIAEALNIVAQNEFFFSEFPRSMSCVALALRGVGMSAGSFWAYGPEAEESKVNAIEDHLLASTRSS
ncbi:hypothetical protein ACET3Z_007784 [Daucus carota]